MASLIMLIIPHNLFCLYFLVNLMIKIPHCSHLKRINSIKNNTSIIHILSNLAVFGLTLNSIFVATESTPPVSTTHICTLLSFSMTLYVPLSSENSPAV